MTATLFTFAAVVAGFAAGRRAVEVTRSERATRWVATGTDLRPTGEAVTRWPGAAPAWLARRLADAGFDETDPSTVWRVWVLGGWVVALLAVLFAGPLIGLVVTTAVLCAPLAVVWAWRDRGAGRYEAAMPRILDDLSSALRAGDSLLGALRQVAGQATGLPATDLARVVDSVERGGSFGEALGRWAADRPLAGVRLASVAMTVGVATGGRQARAIESVAQTLRAQDAVRREASALATQSKASGLVMAVIPIVFATASAMLDPRVAHVLLHTAPGGLCLLGGLAFNVIAAVWMSRVTGARL